MKPDARGGLAIMLRKPGSEVANIRDHHPHASDIWFLFLGTGTAIGGFLWLVLPQYQALRHALAVRAIDRNWLGFVSPGPSWLMAVHPAGREVFTWLDFSMITGFMLVTAAIFAAGLSLATALESWLAGRLGADGDFRVRFLELAYQYLPVAMISLVLGLGGELFAILARAIGAAATHDVEFALFAGSVLWSLAIGRRLLQRQGLRQARATIAILPALAGCAFAGLAWWPALFGL